MSFSRIYKAIKYCQMGYNAVAKLLSMPKHYLLLPMSIVNPKHSKENKNCYTCINSYT